MFIQRSHIRFKKLRSLNLIANGILIPFMDHDMNIIMWHGHFEISANLTALVVKKCLDLEILKIYENAFQSIT